VNKAVVPVAPEGDLPEPSARDRELDLRGLVDRRKKILTVVGSVMKEGVHYGTIPGCKKPSLYQPGAEVLASTFMLRPRLRIDDLSSPTEIRYRVQAEIVHYPTGEIVGEGIGECSSAEEKYAWREALCDEEWDSFPETERRIKFKKVWSGPQGRREARIEKIKQVRTSPADVANTILLMATKRCTVKGIRSTVGASDIFTQGIEDLPDLRMAEEDETDPGAAEPEPPEEERASILPFDLCETIRGEWHEKGKISDPQKRRLFAIAASHGWNGDAVSEAVKGGLEVRVDDLPWGKPYDLVVHFFETHAPEESAA
jgi:hypothetical protein